MALETGITIIGNMVDDPELRFTPNGDPVANFTVASTPRKYNSTTSEWEDGDTLFLRGSVWRQAAENAAESLQRGNRVIVHGNLVQRSYENSDGEKRTIFELDNCEIAASLQFATATIQRNSKPEAVKPQTAKAAVKTAANRNRR